MNLTTRFLVVDFQGEGGVFRMLIPLFPKQNKNRAPPSCNYRNSLDLKIAQIVKI